VHTRGRTPSDARTEGVCVGVGYQGGRASGEYRGGRKGKY